MRRQILTVIAIVCGALAAGLFWNSSLRPKRPPLTDSYARSLGFRSAAQLEELKTTGMNLIRHGRGWTDEDFVYYKRAVTGDTDKPAQVAIFALGELARIDQCREGLVILGRRPITSARREAWADALRRWNANPQMRPLVAEAIKGDNPDLAQLAKETVNAETTAKR